MSCVLDAPVFLGDSVVAAISRITISRIGGVASAAFVGRKMPVAVLIGRGGDAKGLALDGSILELEQIEALCPGAVARFAALANGF